LKRIDKHDNLGIFPGFHQRRAVAGGLEDFYILRIPLPQVANHAKPDTIIPAIGVADPND